jgi:hypothetical protein
MKKFFAIAAIATVLVACGESKTTEEATKTDTLSNQATDAATQVAGAADSAGKTAVDTANAVVDTLKK